MSEKLPLPVGWNYSHFGSFLTPIDRSFSVVDDEEYHLCGVRWYGNGAFIRETKLGKEIKIKGKHLIEEGDVIYNKLFAWKGSFAVVHKDLDGCCVSDEFPIFQINSSIVLPQYLEYFFLTDQIRQQSADQSRGVSAASRFRLHERDFLKLEIPLPSLEDQRRIVEKINCLAALLNEAKNKQEDALFEARAIIEGIYGEIFGTKPQESWIDLNYYVSELENGKSPQCEARSANEDEWGVLKVGAVSFGVFDETENKALPDYMEPQMQYEVKSGDFLMIRANTKELVGACTFVKTVRPRLLLSDKVFRFHFREGRELDLSFLDHMLKSPAVRSQIEIMATGTSPTMKNISKAKVLSIKVPSYPLEEQKRIVSAIENLQGKVKSLLQLQRRSLVEIEAVLPSVLGRIFLGPS